MKSIEEDPEYQASLADHRAESMGYNHANENSKVLTGKWLAELLGVSPAAVSMAATKEHRCQGYPVYKWKDEDSRYWVPLSVYKDLTEDIEVENGLSTTRSNPPEAESKEVDKTTDSTDTSESSAANNQEESDNQQNSDIEQQEQSGQAETSEKETKKPVADSEDSNNEKAPEVPSEGLVNNSGNISLLPEGQNYVEPVIAGSIGSIGTSLVENDTPNGRAVMYSTTVGVLAYLGYKISDDNIAGAILGALIGFGTAYFGNMSYNHSNHSKSTNEENEQDLSDIKPQAHIGSDSKQSNQPIDWANFMKDLRSIGNGKNERNEQLHSVNLPTNKTS